VSLVGQTLDGRYRLTQHIGSGSTGEVYQAQHLGLGRTFAVKVLHDLLAHQPTFAGRFKREGKALARLAHPNIVRIFDACAESHLYIVMELVEGERLDRIQRHLGAFPVQRTLRLARQLASAIEHAHQAEVLHRDLRPANLLISDLPAGEELKILDFGISKIIAADYRESKMVSREYAATDVLPHYKSPEQLRFAHVDRTCDIYAIGCILYELLTGERPFVGSSAEIINGHLAGQAVVPSKRAAGTIPPALDKLVMTCLAKDPRRRFQSGRELTIALEHLESRPAGPRRNVQIVAEEVEDDLHAALKALLPADDAAARALQALRAVQSQHELWSQEGKLAGERQKHLEAWASRYPNQSGELAALRAEAAAQSERARQRVEALDARLDEACRALEELVSRRVGPSSEGFLLVHRLKRLRSG